MKENHDVHNADSLPDSRNKSVNRNFFSKIPPFTIFLTLINFDKFPHWSGTGVVKLHCTSFLIPGALQI